MSEQQFWKSDLGDKFAQACSTWAEGTDQDMLGYFQQSGTSIFTKVLKHLKKEFEFSHQNVSILDIGCSTGGKLAILESLGCQNLYGIDISKKAIQILKENHENYQAQVINGFDYNVFHTKGESYFLDFQS